LGLTTQSKRTLMAPERLNNAAPKNVAADGTFLCSNCDHREAEIGRTTNAYATG
jgi:hypothetical protein